MARATPCPPAATERSQAGRQPGVQLRPSRWSHTRRVYRPRGVGFSRPAPEGGGQRACGRPLSCRFESACPGCRDHAKFSVTATSSRAGSVARLPTVATTVTFPRSLRPEAGGTCRASYVPGAGIPTPTEQIADRRGHRVVHWTDQQARCHEYGNAKTRPRGTATGDVPGRPGRAAPRSGRDRRRAALHQSTTGGAACAGVIAARILPHGSVPGRTRRPGRLVDHRRARATPRRRCSCTRHRRLAPSPDADLSRDRVLHAFTGLGLPRSSRHRPASSTSRPSVRCTHERVYATCGSSTPPNARSKRSSAPQGNGRGSRPLPATNPSKSPRSKP